MLQKYVPLNMHTMSTSVLHTEQMQGKMYKNSITNIPW